MSGPYRVHRLRSGDEQALTILARGNGRFAGGGAEAALEPLADADAKQFVADDRTVFLVALEQSNNHIAGFVYACVLYRRHTKLRHLCVYEIGVDMDHRGRDVPRVLLQALASEAQSLGIDQGFVVTTASNSEAINAYCEAGGTLVAEPAVLAMRF